MGGGGVWRGVCLWGDSWRKGAFCSVCIFHNQKMHVYLILFLANAPFFPIHFRIKSPFTLVKLTTFQPPPTTVTRLLDYLQNIWTFPTLKFDQWQIKLAKLSSKFSQILITHFQNSNSFLMLCQRGQILPNLVTLPPTFERKHFWVKMAKILLHFQHTFRTNFAN